MLAESGNQMNVLLCVHLKLLHTKELLQYCFSNVVLNKQIHVWTIKRDICEFLCPCLSGGILFLSCLRVSLCLCSLCLCPQNFNLGYNFWSTKDNVFKIGIWTDSVKYLKHMTFICPKLYKIGLFELQKYKSYHSASLVAIAIFRTFTKYPSH